MAKGKGWGAGGIMVWLNVKINTCLVCKIPGLILGVGGGGEMTQ